MEINTRDKLVIFGGSVDVHPSQSVEVYAYTDKGKKIAIHLNDDQVRLFAETILFSKKHNGMHLGHSFWHIQNKRPFSKKCMVCRQSEPYEALIFTKEK